MPYLSEWQHGFIKGRSCTTQLALTCHQWAKASDEGRQIDVAFFLIFVKAFDRVPHNILSQKICNFGISGSLLSWCADYLSNRRQRVVIDGAYSPWSVVSSGVPQVSILVPIFFVIFISDLSDCISSGNVIALYADDCNSSRIIDSPQDHVLFQRDLDNLCSWSRLDSMDFNIKKCKLMRISKKKQPLEANLVMYESSLGTVSEYKDLGLS